VPLILAGYADHPRIEKGFRWLLKMRQNNVSWVIGSPGITGVPHLTRQELYDLTSNGNRETAWALDKSRPFSAAGTGMVLRAFSAHPAYKKSKSAQIAALLLKSNSLKKTTGPPISIRITG